MNRRTPFTASLLLVPLVLTACAAQGGPPGSPSPSSAPGTGSPTDGGAGENGEGLEHPTGADQPVLIIDSAGGFVPVEFTVTQVPSFALYGDGRVVMMGMQTLEYPGPAMPPLIERRLTERGVQAVLETVVATGQFESSRELRGAMNIVADAADTRFALAAGGREVLVSIYGLGTILPDTELPQDLPAGEIEAHEALGMLNDRLLTLDSWLPSDAWASDGWVPYEPDRLRLYVREVTDEPVEDEGLQEVMEWPAADDPAEFGTEEPFFANGTRCGVVEGDAGEAWLRALGEATQATVWSDDGERRFSVLPRPLLPHEAAECPELMGGA